MPRVALLLLCLAYVVPGFFGRAPWKSMDMAALGYMQALAGGHTDWLAPELLGMAVDANGLLPYWLGASAMLWIPPSLMAAEVAARLPFLIFLAGTLALTWGATFRLAQHPGAQPVAFAFGGEARPIDYAKAVADGALLALIACLGLAQRGHETSVYLAQVCFTAMVLQGAAMSWTTPRSAVLALALGHTGLTLSGAPMLSLLFGAGHLRMCVVRRKTSGPSRTGPLVLVGVLALNSVVATALNLWRWQLVWPGIEGNDWGSLLKLGIWFGWPAWPLAFWTLWQWRHHLRQITQYPHLAYPLWFAGVVVIATVLTPPADRTLLLGLPALAMLAAFALPTLKRSMAAWVEWFTLLFFSVSVLAIWTIWLAMQTGFPAKPAANIAKLAPSFSPSFEWLPTIAAVLGSAAWAYLVWWRARRHRMPLWKTLVLPASGAGLCWLLLSTLWMPLLDHARSYTVQIERLRQAMPNAASADCLFSHELSRAQVAALIHHGYYALRLPTTESACNWLVTTPHALQHKPLPPVPGEEWHLVAQIERPTDRDDSMLLLQRRDLGQQNTR